MANGGNEPILRIRLPRRRRRVALLLACVLVSLLSAQSVRSTSPVDLILVLALDVSSSVDKDEFDLQKLGLAAAFRHPLVAKAIARGRAKRIVVATVQWAGYRQQKIMLPWTVIDNGDEAASYADKLAAMPRAFPGGATHLSGIVDFGATLAMSTPFSAMRRVVDISGDGTDNISGPPHRARDDAVRAGVTINGLAIANEAPELTRYYRDAVIGGPGAFVLTARTYDDYPDAILRKLVREIETRLII